MRDYRDMKINLIVKVAIDFCLIEQVVKPLSKDITHGVKAKYL